MMSQTTENQYQGYINQSLEQLKNWGLKIWDIVDIYLKSNSYINNAVILPRYEHSEDGILSLKLTSGYNTGIRIDEIKSIKHIGESVGNYKIPDLTIKMNKKLPKISILGLGGTIASRLDYRTGGVIPAITPNELFALNPELADLANVSTRLLFKKFSEDLNISNWLQAANEIATEFNKGARGVVVGHGTDTLGYGSAVLSFALQNLPGPVVMTAAQRSSDRPSSDAYQNLMDATYAASYGNFAEVVVCMHGQSSDESSYLHKGVWVRKMHSSRRDAFQSINATPIGKIDHRKKKIELSALIKPLPANIKHEAENRKVVADLKFEEKVGLIYTYPGIPPELIQFFVDNKYRGLVIAGTGLGHTPNQLLPALHSAIKDAGMYVVMASQTLHGYVGLHVYEKGRELLTMGVIPGQNLLPETAFVKLSYILGHYSSNEKEAILSAFQKNIVGEFTPVEEYSLYPSSSIVDTPKELNKTQQIEIDQSNLDE